MTGNIIFQGITDKEYSPSFCSRNFLFTKSIFFTFVCRFVAYGSLDILQSFSFLYAVPGHILLFILYDEFFDKTNFFVKRKSQCC